MAIGIISMAMVDDSLPRSSAWRRLVAVVSSLRLEIVQVGQNMPAVAVEVGHRAYVVGQLCVQILDPAVELDAN